MDTRKKRRAAAKKPRAENAKKTFDGLEKTFGHDVQKAVPIRKMPKRKYRPPAATKDENPVRTTEGLSESGITNQNDRGKETVQDGFVRDTKEETFFEESDFIQNTGDNTSGQHDQSRRVRARRRKHYQAHGAGNAKPAVQPETARNFTEQKSDFVTESGSKTENGEKTARADMKIQRGRKRLQREQDKLKRTEYSLERVFNAETGRAEYRLAAVKKEPGFQKGQPVRQAAEHVIQQPLLFAHRKVSEAEHENAGVEAAHKSEQRAEDVFHFVKQHRKTKNQRQRAGIKRLERIQTQREVQYRYQQFLEQEQTAQENVIKRQIKHRMQKMRIKREYAKAQRAGNSAKTVKETAVKTADAATAVARKIQELAKKHAALFIMIAVLVLLLVMIMTSLSSCGAMFTSEISTTLAGSYMSAPAEMDAADLAFSSLEMELQEEVNSVESDNPGYDEYRYNLAEIGHDPFALISYFSAKYTEFTASSVQGEIESLFDEMYELTLTPTEETRTRTVTKTGTRTVIDPVTGEETEEEYEYEEEEEYTVTILDVKLTAKSLSVIAAGRLDSEQIQIFTAYNETHGLIQQFYTPLNLYWYNYVSSYYGYRINPVTGEKQFHRGVDIAVPTGTMVLAAMDGTITEAAYDDYYGNYVVISDADGYVTKYAHMDTLSVSAGQTVKHGDTIGTTGNTGSSTGSHLHIECLYNGEYYNPLFYFEAGEGTLYGETQAAGSGGNAGDAAPPESFDDAQVQALADEIAKYIGYPYVWGGSSPSTSFDCSGFVCWVYSNSGTYDLPRTTAQGIYDQCVPVSAEDAKPGDIIFFTGTYASAGPVSHVGIYLGNGVMAHAGAPIKYSSINTSYWQSHFYAFGRLQ